MLKLLQLEAQLKVAGGRTDLVGVQDLTNLLVLLTHTNDAQLHSQVTAAASNDSTR